MGLCIAIILTINHINCVDPPPGFGQGIFAPVLLQFAWRTGPSSRYHLTDTPKLLTALAGVVV